MAGKIYVQIDIATPIERLWELTQTPAEHQRWDLRFTEIDYLPRPDPTKPQRFEYATRIGFGLRIRGEGETSGSHEANGLRTSALRFWSDSPLSLIREGSGYWQYTPATDGSVRFVTGYDYAVRFGLAGRVFDRFVFRPLIGWATAWSFDRLRLWLERGITPEISMQHSLVHVIARLTVAFIWLWHGIVPKLIFMHADEISPLTASGFSDVAARQMVTAAGWIEVAIGLILLIFRRWRWPLYVTLIAMPAALIGVTATTPYLLKAAFNPMSLNVAMFALALIALVSGRDLPTAANCLREPEKP